MAREMTISGLYWRTDWSARSDSLLQVPVFHNWHAVHEHMLDTFRV